MSLRRKPECPLHTRQQTVDPDTLENVPVGKSKPQRLRGGGCCGECTDFACCLFIAVSGFVMGNFFLNNTLNYLPII